MAQRQPPAGRPMAADEDPRDAVARARAHVLAGRGPGAEQVETDRYKRERPTLGPLAAPLARELVHLNTAAFRSGSGADDVGETDLQNQRDRLRVVWGAPHHASPQQPWRRSRIASYAGFVAGVSVGLTLAWLGRRRR